MAETRRRTVRRGSLAWVSKSRDEWIHTLGLSFDRYKRALALMPSCARLIALNLASMGKGTLWLDPDGLQTHLETLFDDA